MIGKSLKNLTPESKSTITSSDLLNTIIDNVVFESNNDFQKYHYEITRTLSIYFLIHTNNTSETNCQTANKS